MDIEIKIKKHRDLYIGEIERGKNRKIKIHFNNIYISDDTKVFKKKGKLIIKGSCDIVEDPIKKQKNLVCSIEDFSVDPMKFKKLVRKGKLKKLRI